MQLLEKILLPLLISAALGSGIIAGLLFIFSNTIMRALAQMPHPQGLVTMQAINVIIVNPLFLLFFVGTAILSVVALVFAFTHWNHAASAYIVAAALLYLLGTIGITAFGNVPLNDRLATLNPSDVQATAFWVEYYTTWTMWNHLRTAAAICSLLCWVLAVRKV
jgi:uncharacterized membrane protein